MNSFMSLPLSFHAPSTKLQVVVGIVYLGLRGVLGELVLVYEYRFPTHIMTGMKLSDMLIWTQWSSGHEGNHLQNYQGGQRSSLMMRSREARGWIVRHSRRLEVSSSVVLTFSCLTFL